MTEAAPANPPASPHEWRPARFLVIAAHPDDADFGPAAIAARWIDEGSVGWLVCCTSGDQGGDDPDADPFELAEPWGLTPHTSAPRSTIVSFASRNSHASTVQPGVSSFGYQ